MKQRILFFLICYHSIQINCSQAQIPAWSKKDLIGVFDGRTPCQEMAAQLNETTIPECIKIKWRLILYKDSITGGPGTFILYGFKYKNDSPAKGKWHIIKGTKANPQALVYQIDIPKKNPLLLQKGDDNIFFFLDREKNLMVGNRDFSYTLNRVERN